MYFPVQATRPSEVPMHRSTRYRQHRRPGPVPGRYLWMALLALALAACQREPPPDAREHTEAVDLQVMSFNIEWGGGHVRFDSVTEAIRQSGADIVGIQEAEGNLRRLAQSLGWHYNERNYVVSRFPLIDPPGGEGRYLLVEVAPGRAVALANVHLPSDPYGPYWVRDGRDLDEVLALERQARLPKIGPTLEALPPLAVQGMPVFLTGDFNAPSHRDWTAAAVGTRQHLLYAVDWPVSQALEQAGFRDAWRAVHPDPLSAPGLTWFAGRPAIETWNPGPDEPLDRIDFIWSAGPAEAVTARLVGEPGGPGVEVAVAPWPSDHRAVLVRFRATPAPLPRLVAASQQVHALGEVIPIRRHDPAGQPGQLVVTRTDEGGGVRMVKTLAVAAGQSELQLDSAELGTGWFQLILSDIQHRRVARNDFWVRDPAAPITVQVSGQDFQVGQPVPVSWHNGPGYRNDWLGIFPAGAPADSEQPLAFAYLRARSAGGLLLQAETVEYSWPLPEDAQGWPLPPGRYVARLLMDDSFQVLAQSDPFTVTPAP